MYKDNEDILRRIRQLEEDVADLKTNLDLHHTELVKLVKKQHDDYSHLKEQIKELIGIVEEINLRDLPVELTD